MQFRQLRYFVKIVEAGSFSRAAATIHVAQPALSQQIAELEERLGFTLLQRSARGVRPTAAGEILYREASSILRQLEQLPAVIRSSTGEATGVVSIGMSSTLAAGMAGAFIEACRSALPKVTIKLAVADSEAIKGRVESNGLDMALVFEDELVSNFARRPLFRQRLYAISPSGKTQAHSITLEKMAQSPLILPEPSNVTRRLLDRAFESARIVPNVATEADQLSSMLSAVRSGIGITIVPKGDFSDIGGDGLHPLLLEPALHLTSSIISSSDYPLTHSGEAVRDLLTQFMDRLLKDNPPPGSEWIAATPL